MEDGQGARQGLPRQGLMVEGQGAGNREQLRLGPANSLSSHGLGSIFEWWGATGGCDYPDPGPEGPVSLPE